MATSRFAAVHILSKKPAPWSLASRFIKVRLADGDPRRTRHIADKHASRRIRTHAFKVNLCRFHHVGKLPATPFALEYHHYCLNRPHSATNVWNLVLLIKLLLTAALSTNNESKILSKSWSLGPLLLAKLGQPTFHQNWLCLLLRYNCRSARCMLPPVQTNTARGCFQYSFRYFVSVHPPHFFFST